MRERHCHRRWTILLAALIVLLTASCAGDNSGFLSQTASYWSKLGLMYTVDPVALEAAPCVYSIQVASDDMVLLSPKDGTTGVGAISKGTKYLVFGLTRVVMLPTDRDWTHYLYVKTKPGGPKFWDALVKVDRDTWLKFLNTAFIQTTPNLGDKVISTALDGRRAYVTVYLVDNARGEIRILSGDQIVRAMPKEALGRTLHFYDLLWDEKPDGVTYRFHVESEEVWLGWATWDPGSGTVTIKTQEPIDVHQGDGGG